MTNQPQAAGPNEAALTGRLLALPDLIGDPKATPPKSAMLPYSYSELRRLWLANKFPKPLSINRRKLVWAGNVVGAWMDAAVAATTTEHELAAT